MMEQSGAGAGASLAPDLEFARHLAQVAGKLALDFFRNGVQTRHKPDGSPVSDADVEIERVLRRLIAEQRPEDGVLGEELGLTGSSERRWILDPIDGTSNFVAGRPQWGTHVALEIAGEVALGVITRPVLGSSWWASRGGGAHKSLSGAASSERLSVSAVNELGACRITLWTHEADPTIQRLEQHCRWAHPDLNSLLRVAEGQLDALIDRSGKPWDIAPAVVIVEEAGGRYSDRDGGRRLDLCDGRFSNGHLHAQLERLLA
jgi:histidinol-phosphatase